MKTLLLSRLAARIGYTFPVTNTDCLIRESPSEYQARTKISITQADLEAFDDNALLYIKQKHGLAEPEKDYTKDVVYDAAYKIITQGEKAFDHYFSVCPIMDSYGEPVSHYFSAFSNWAEQQDKTPLDASQALLARQMAHSIRQQPLAMKLISEGIAGSTVTAEMGETRCTGRIPWFNPKYGIITFVFTDYRFETTGRYLMRNAARQAAFSAMLMEQHVHKHIPIHVIAVEAAQPQRCAVWRVSWRLLSESHRQNKKMLRGLQNAQRKNQWPGGFEKLQTLDVSF